MSSKHKQSGRMQFTLSNEQSRALRELAGDSGVRLSGRVSGGRFLIDFIACNAPFLACNAPFTACNSPFAACNAPFTACNAPFGGERPSASTAISSAKSPKR